MNKIPITVIGLKTLLTLDTKGNKDLLYFPDRKYFPAIRKIIVDYPYHCCQFLKPKESPKSKGHSLAHLDGWSWRWAPEEGQNDTSASGDSPLGGYSSTQMEPLIRGHNATKSVKDGTHHPIPIIKDGEEHLFNKITCSPEPNVFYPCDDLMTKTWLRVCVWFVFLLALIGNSVVLFVIIANVSKLDVQRYLMLNLAFADLLLGIYLGFLAIVDILTTGDFRKHALEWQFSSSCKAAGFLAVFASELSVYTLAVITIERFITIKYSMYIEKQVSICNAVVIMAFGWILSLIMAAMPLIKIDTDKGVFHFSDYSKYSVCLPFDIPDEDEIAHTPSLTYIAFILLFNITAFVIIVICYVKIFMSVRGSGAFSSSGDSRIARRVALLIFTDFACWFPIAIFALAATFDRPIIKDLWISKVFTVFVFPLNACANPFLYAIFTKQFRKDCFAVYRHVKLADNGFTERLSRRFSRGSLKFTPSYQAFRRGSSCSFLFGRRCSAKTDELRLSSRSNTTYRTPLNTDDEREREEERAEYKEKETCL